MAMKGYSAIVKANLEVESALEKGLNTIIEVVKANGNFIKTPASSDKQSLQAFYEDFDGLMYHRDIHGLRWDEENGLTMCTNDMLDNYQFDNDYCFEYYFDFEGEDLSHLNDALSKPEYFVSIDDCDCQMNETIKSILAGLISYLED